MQRNFLAVFNAKIETFEMILIVQHKESSPYLLLLSSLGLVLIKSLFPLVELFERPISRVVHNQLKCLLPACCGGHTLNNRIVNFI